ncbi:hypothetical protein H7J51_00160 [Mycobacterium crocinum]|uniref:ATPase n=1 Tax=Mycolicibacterium crocinum TaxID=388459 RepID=A0ABY5TT47_9MYCO|nr:hypothetical protein [Mycolicibacterium crocinum]MCV7213698.1 hypothetical protein [Mycolicibacterium crocinum]UVY96068.1 hypothetical protein MI149_30315 [Mycolicibacterium crocinum]
MAGTAADRIKANAERLRKAPAQPTVTPESSEPVPETAPAPVVRQKTVRRTVDLSPTAHRGLDNWQRDTADRLGLARVTGQEVLTALVDRLLADSKLAEQIVRSIAGQRP